MSFFEELQANYEETVKRSEAARKVQAEKEAEQYLLPVLEKHFRKENPEASSITIIVIAVKERQIKVEASQKEHDTFDKIYYDHNLGKAQGHQFNGKEDLTAKEICEAMCRIASKLYPNFRGTRRNGTNYAFEYTLTFVMPEKKN